ncbi:sulfate transporter 1.3, partial [Tanacetum coccineum]
MRPILGVLQQLCSNAVLSVLYSLKICKLNGQDQAVSNLKPVATFECTAPTIPNYFHLVVMFDICKLQRGIMGTFHQLEWLRVGFTAVEIGLCIAVAISFAKILLQVNRPITAILGKIPQTSVYKNIGQYPEATKVL